MICSAPFFLLLFTEGILCFQRLCGGDSALYAPRERPLGPAYQCPVLSQDQVRTRKGSEVMTAVK